MHECEKRDGENIKTGTSSFHIEIDRVYGGISVSVYGVFSILDFNDSLAVLKLKKGKVRVTGQGLSVAVYENRTVEICGKVEGVAFI